MTTKIRNLDGVKRDINNTLKTLVVNKRKLGELLVEARNFFDSNDLFDKWISGNFPDELDPKTIFNYKLLAKVFKDGLPKDIPQSGLYAIAAKKNDDIREKVLDKLGDKKVSLKDVSAAIDEVREDDNEEKEYTKTMDRIAHMCEQDSIAIIRTLVDNVGKETVLKWVGELDKTEQEKAA